jgi:hypothetical protein
VKVLVTTSQSLLLVDTESGEYRPIDRGHGLYYGMAVHGGQLYVAARNGDAERGGEILVFDAELRRCGSIPLPFPTQGLHEIAWHDEKLWVTFTSENMIGIFDGTEWEEWYPLERQERDVFHFNSLMFEPGRAWVLAHNYGYSFLLECSYPEKRVISRAQIGNHAHNVRRVGGQIVVCSSGDGVLLGADGLRVTTGAWPRGLATDNSAWCVGLSAPAERSERGFTNGELMICNNQWLPQRTVALPAEGMVLDVLRLPPGFRTDQYVRE